MVRKKLAMAVLALSALQANFANALGLGNLAIKSALNQPLNAEIKLLDTGDLDPSQIKIQLAAPEDFQRAGVDRDFFLTNLRFSVDMDGHGGGTIKISTREPVVEPYLNFVIEARWPNGRLLREFAVLLDPPTFSANKSAAPVAPATSSGMPAAKRAPVQPPMVKTEMETTKTAPAADMSLPATGKKDEYRIQVYDTLSKIAMRFKPAGDVSIAQTMIAIQRANPQVFIRNNVNLIKSGYVLRIPSADEARTIAADQAAQEVDAQNQEWRGGTRSSGSATAAATGPQLDASAPEPSKKEGGFREQARLSIATSGESDKGAAGSGGSGKGVETLRNQLTASQEALEKGKRDNKELQSRLDDMERQIATLQRLISLKDDQLAALQNKSASAKSAPQAAPNVAQTAPVATPVPVQTPTPEPATGAAPTTETPAATPPAAAAPEIKPEPPKPAANKPLPAPAPEPGLIDQLTANTTYLFAAAAALVLALIGFILAKRRKDAEEEGHDTLAFDAGDSFQFDNVDLDNAAISDDAVTPAEPESIAGTAVSEAPVEPPKKGVRSETGDAIAESDIYIAYGRYQQAVDLLSHAIDAEPNRSDLRVKLLEVYVEMRNKDAFRQQFVALQGLGDSKAIAHVKDMLSSVDGISDWLDDLPGSSSSYVTPIAAAVAAAATTAAIAEEKSDSDADLDLDLELEDDLNTAHPSKTIMNLDSDFDGENSFASSAIQGEESPEFTLDLDDEIDESGATAEFTSNFDSLSRPAESTVNNAGFESNFDNTNLNDLSAPAPTEEGMELDLGDDDLDHALSQMSDSENLGDLEEMSAALGDMEVKSSSAFNELEHFNTDLSELSAAHELPEEFDLSQTSIELPNIERADLEDAGLDLEQSNFDAPSSDQFNSSQPEIDVFAGLNQSQSTLNQPQSTIAPEPAYNSAPTPTSSEAPPTLDGGDDFDFLADADEVATKLDLARAYIDMGDTDGAKDILDEVLHEGTDTQKQEASTLLSRMG